ncbi:hypothetical protein FOL47_003438 [Perkinsus chesapeaki]|uniref:Uncharacterized protein n=1 Tax=Perkinsus chesapeaki TaxID=330153 RepID=A0A7J6M846_PERCH|nr:hypothetical protein FOL47_003438 [Perkinsus chesapeaki]
MSNDSGERPHIGWEIEKMTESVDSTHHNIQDLKTKITAVVGRLNQIKLAVSLALPAASTRTGGFKRMDAEVTRRRLEQLRKEIADYKSHVYEMAETAETRKGGLRGTIRKKGAVDDKSKSLYERLGGVSDIEAAVDLLYDKALADPRTRAHFDKTQKKMGHIRKRMQTFLVSYVGGPATYDEEDLKPVHYNMNIMDYHFDAMLEHLGSSLAEMGTHPEAIADCMQLLGRVRKYITTGCTVRRALARKAREQGRDELFLELGESGGIENFMTRTYDIVKVDDRLRTFFKGKDLDAIKHRQTLYMCELLGGPRMYEGRSMVEIHDNLKINDYLFDCFIMDAERALHGLNLTEDLHDIVVSTLEDQRKYIVKGHNDGDTVKLVDGKTILERVGGEMNVEAVVETMYFGAQRDPRIKFFFVMEKEKLTAVKRKVSEFLCGALGGQSSIDVNIVRAAHYPMNIGDHQFDALVENLAAAMELMEVEGSVKSDVLDVVSHLRGEITAGATSRLEIARKKTESAGTDGLYKTIGGDDGVVKLVDELYKICLVDDRIKKFFQGEKLESVKANQTVFLQQLLGGSADSPSGVVTCDLNSFLPSPQMVQSLDHSADNGHDLIGLNPSPLTVETVLRLRPVTLPPDPSIPSRGSERLKSILLDAASVKTFSRESLNGYNGRDLPRIHQTIQIQDWQFDAFMDNARKAFANLGTDDDTIDECTVLMETTRRDVVSEENRQFDVRQMMHDAHKKVLYERIGGEVTIARLCDSMYAAALDDDRLRFFFEKNKAKVQSIKKKMTQFICGALGGPTTYDIADLRPAHYSMNITSHHFDAMLSIVKEILIGELEFNRTDAREVLRALQPVRGDIINGYTVRSEIAKRATEKGLDQMFLRVGESEGITRITASLFSILGTDARLKQFFKPDKRDRIKEGVTVFLVDRFGGPKNYQGRDLAATHAGLDITDYHFDAFVADFLRALGASGIDETVVDELLVTLEPLRSQVLGQKDEVPAALIKNGQTIIERLGGDDQLETLVETLIEKVGNDNRLEFYFEKGHFKLRNIRRRLYQFMSGAFGGPVQYDADRLKPAHYDMNITDFHFDAFISVWTATCKEFDVDSESTEDSIEVLNGVRSAITGGCVIRMEMSRKKAQLESPEQLFERLGKKEGIIKITDKLYTMVTRDHRINMFFEGSKLKALWKGFTTYFIQALGGPQEYRGRGLGEVHGTLAINDYHLDCFLQLLNRSQLQLGFDRETCDDTFAQFEKLRPQILHAHYVRSGYVHTDASFDI